MDETSTGQVVRSVIIRPKPDKASRVNRIIDRFIQPTRKIPQINIAYIVKACLRLIDHVLGSRILNTIVSKKLKRRLLYETEAAETHHY